MNYVYTLKYVIDNQLSKYSFVSDQEFTAAFNTAFTEVTKQHNVKDVGVQSLSRFEGDEVPDEEPDYEH